MVFTRRSKGGEREQLLSNIKSERSEDLPRVLRKKNLSKRISAIFKKSNEQKQLEPWNDDAADTETAPPTPEAKADEKIDLQIFSNKPYAGTIEENERLPDDRSYGATTISDLSVSINPITFSSPRHTLYGGLSRSHYDEDDIVDGQASCDFESKTTKQDNFDTSCVVQGLLGLMDQTCGTTPIPDYETKYTDDSAGNKPGGQYDSMYSVDLTTDTGDNTAFYGSTIVTNDDQDNGTRTSVTTCATVITETHEDFELILDPKSLRSAPELKPVSELYVGQVGSEEAPLFPNGKKSSTSNSKSASSPTRVPRANPAQKISPLVKILTGRNKSNSNTTSSPERRRRLKLNLNINKDGKNKTPNVVSQAAETNSPRCQVVKKSKQTEENCRPANLSVDKIREDELLGEEYIEENGTSTGARSLLPPVELVDQPVVDARKLSKETPPSNANKEMANISSTHSWTVSLNRVLPFGRSSLKKDEELNSVKTSPPRLADNSKSAAVWKEVADPTTGRPYYYHRLTRKTTWTEPSDYMKAAEPKREPKESKRATPQIKKDLCSKSNVESQESKTYADQIAEFNRSDDDDTLPDSLVILSYSELSAENQKEIDEGKTELVSKEPKSSIIKKISMKTFESVDEKQDSEEPKNKPMVDVPKDEIDEQQIRSLDRVKSLPFDEPSEAEASQQGCDNVAVTPRTRSVNTVVTGKTEQSSSSAKTGKTEVSTNTGKTENTTKSERTERIKNTNEEDFVRVKAANRSNTGFDDNSLSSDNEPGQILPVSKQRNTGSGTVQRTRNLRVEEFTSSRFGLTTENYNDQASPPRTTARQRRLLGLKKQLPAQESKKGPIAAITSELKIKYHNSFEPEDYYNGDNDETDYDTLTDTVSALSNPDVEFQNLHHNFDKARREALDDAIRRKDWDLAASVIDHIRNRSFERGESNYYFQEEWTQSEIDKFISESDWDAVSSYIAFMSDNNDNLAVKTDEINAPLDEDMPLDEARTTAEKKMLPEIDATVSSKDASVQKRFGARSQLQHEEDDMPSISSWDSESFWESDYSSASSEDGRQRLYLRQREKFAC